MTRQTTSGDDLHNHGYGQAPAVSLKRRFFSAPALLSLAVAVALIALLATRFNPDWGATWDNIRAMDPWAYALAFVLYYLSFSFRGLRWRLLARNAQVHTAPGARLPSTFQCAQLILIGWFVNTIAWLRVGDAYRAYGFSQDSRGSFSSALGTILAERVLDMATIFGILIVSAIFLITTSGSAASGYLLAAAFAMALALAGLMALMRVYGARLARILPRRLEDSYHKFHQGTLGSFKQLPTLLALGLSGWLLEIARLYFVIQALDLSISPALVPVVAMGTSLLTIVPTPGGVGAVEPGVTGLLMLSLARPDAVSVTLVDRSITYVSVILVGGLVFAIRQFTHARRPREGALAAERGAEHRNATES